MCNLVNTHTHTHTHIYTHKHARARTHTYKALARYSRTPWEEALAEPPKLGQHDNEEIKGKVQGNTGEGAMAFMECLGVP